MKNEVIKIKGARVNNLKNIDLELPRNKMIIMTGLSGSGKTSLAFDTIYAEGQRRYVESLSSYARQFLGGIEKPDVDEIEGLSPAISIDQKTTSNNPRSTVGTVTEIYDYLRLLYARCGVPYCPKHNEPIEAQTISQMVKRIMSGEDGIRLEILSPIATREKGTFKDVFENLKKEGYLRVYVDGVMVMLDEAKPLEKNKKHTVSVVVDRIKKKADIESRLSDSLETALKLADGLAVCKTSEEEILFSSNYACPKCGFSLPRLEPRLFSFNSPLGACDNCKGLGITLEVDRDLLIPDDSLSIRQGGIKYYKNFVDSDRVEWQNFKALCDHYHIDLDKPLNKFTKEEMDIILYGSKEPIKYEINTSGGTKYTKNTFIEGIKAEDIDWLLNVFLHAEKFSAVNNAFYVYRKYRQGSITGTADIKSIENILHTLDIWIDKLDKEKYEGVKEEVLGFLCTHYMCAVLIYDNLPEEQKKGCKGKLKKYRFLVNYSQMMLIRIFGHMPIIILSKLLNLYRKRCRF